MLALEMVLRDGYRVSQWFQHCFPGILAVLQLEILRSQPLQIGVIKLLPFHLGCLAHFAFSGHIGDTNERCFGQEVAMLKTVFFIDIPHLFGGLEHVFPYIGNNSSQLAFIFFRGVAQPPTSHDTLEFAMGNQHGKANAISYPTNQTGGW